jgi:hypothetical protein
MPPVRRARPIPGSAPRESVPDRALFNGSCPICAAKVLWAYNRTQNLDGSTWYAPLEPTIVEEEHTSTVLVPLLISSTGEASVIEPQLHRKHVCPQEAVQELLRQLGSLGYYTSEVLAVSCPVRMCTAAPGMLCLTQRREAMARPHGARVVISRGEELEDPTF